ncbi:MAG: radical SAM protein [Nanoarchaeota archaeon]
MHETQKFSPVSVHWRITSSCNLRCKHCYVAAGDQNISVNLSDSKNFIDLMAKAWPVEEIIISGGEPTLHPNVKEIIEYVTTKRIKPIIFTNGILTETIKKILPIDELAFIVSLDGFREDHEKLRGPNTWVKTLETISLLIKEKRNLTISFSVNNYNIEKSEAFLKFLTELGVEKVAISQFMPLGRGFLNKELCVNYKDYIRVIEQIKNFSEKSSTEIAVSEEDGLTCTGGINRVSINEKFEVYPCPLLTSKSRWLMGRVPEIFSEEIIPLQLSFLYKKNKDIACKNCSSNNWCSCVALMDMYHMLFYSENYSFKN